MDERKRKRKLLVWVGGTLLVVLCLYGYAVGWDAWSRVNRNLSQARAKGFPVEPQDLFGGETLADAEDAAPDYEELRILHRDSEPLVKDPHRETFFQREASAFEFTVGSTEFTTGDVVAYLADVGEIIKCAERIADKPSFRPRKDWPDPQAVLFGELTPAKYAARLFLTRALLAAEQGDEQAALRDFHRAQVLAHHMRMYGHFLGFNVAASIESMYFRAVQIAVSTPGVEFELHDGLLKDIALWPERPDLTQPLRFAAFEATWLSRHVDRLHPIGFGSLIGTAWSMSEGVPRKGDDWIRLAWHSPGVQADATQKSLDHWSEVLDTYDPDIVDPIAWASKMDAKIPSGTGYSNASEALSRSVSLKLTPHVTLSQEELARRRVLVTALKILRHPASRPEKSLDLDIDPFTGNKLIYKKTRTGFVVYSFARDRDDDGGRSKPSANSIDRDIVFEYPYLREPR